MTVPPYTSGYAYTVPESLVENSADVRRRPGLGDEHAAGGQGERDHRSARQDPDNSPFARHSASPGQPPDGKPARESS